MTPERSFNNDNNGFVSILTTTFTQLATSGRVLGLRAASAALLTGVVPASAGTIYTWTGAANNNWNNAGNWVGAVVPATAADDTVDLSTLDLTAGRTFNLNNG